MRAVVQRVSDARVLSEGVLAGEIQKGLMVLLGVEDGDTQADGDYIAQKLLGLRIFEDEKGVPNLDITEVGGSILLVSQFTLLGDARKGRRPSYIKAARPETAIPLYERMVAALKEKVPVATGVFQTEMQVNLTNDGPFTILLDSKKNF
ncbi:MAG: D-tyrosyl-tRNA(Tyr) deacylase [Clostridia bacterium]|nr:D-tyrosyl-tRNA(Tyr) deacylase [Clostridia bacterium]